MANILVNMSVKKKVFFIGLVIPILALLIIGAVILFETDLIFAKLKTIQSESTPLLVTAEELRASITNLQQ